MQLMFRHIRFVSSQGDKEFIHSILSRHLLGRPKKKGCRENQILIKNKIQELSTDFEFIGQRTNFNQQVIGSGLSEKIYWTSLLTCKMKYLLPQMLAEELMEVFYQLEARFYSQGASGLSSAERGLLSFMRTLATWDADVEILILGCFLNELNSLQQSLIMRCVTELSSWLDVYIPQLPFLERKENLLRHVG